MDTKLTKTGTMQFRVAGCRVERRISSGLEVRDCIWDLLGFPRLWYATLRFRTLRFGFWCSSLWVLDLRAPGVWSSRPYPDPATWRMGVQIMEIAKE